MRRDAHAPRGVLHVINDLLLGGAQRTLLDQAGAGERARHPAEVASLEIVPGGPVAALLRARGVRVHLLRGRGEPLAAAGARLVGLIAARRPAIVHTHLAAAGIAGRVAARAAGVPRVVTTLHNVSDWLERRRGPLRRVDRATLPLAHGIVCVSDAVRDAFGAVAPGLAARAATVRNGVDVAAFRPAGRARADARAILGIAPDVCVVTAVARLERRKGIDVLIEALGRIAPARRPELIVAGAGSERAALEARAAALGLRARFDGARDDVRPYLWAADLCAVPSRSEGLGVTVIEALAAGCPVLAARTGGIPELMDDGACGRLLPPESPAAWAEALAAAAAAPARRAAWSAAGVAHAARFDVSHSNARLAAFYERVLGGAAHGRRDRVAPAADEPAAAPPEPADTLDAAA